MSNWLVGFEVSTHGPIYFEFCNPITIPMGDNLGFEFVGLAYHVVFRFIIEYSSSLKDFGPYGIDLFFYMRIFEI